MAKIWDTACYCGESCVEFEKLRRINLIIFFENFDKLDIKRFSYNYRKMFDTCILNIERKHFFGNENLKKFQNLEIAIFSIKVTN